MILTITAEDNVHAHATRDAAKREGKLWDTCVCCPVAQALCRHHPPFVWLVNRNGARPNGSKYYWYSFSRSLVRALDAFDKEFKHNNRAQITGSFMIWTHKEACQ